MENIVIIIVDALRTKNMSLFGYKRETDTNMKKLSQESILFKNHISVSNSTFPSLTSLFTGKYPTNHGVIHQFPYMEKEELEKLKKNKFWFPSYLKKKGYYNIGIDWIGWWFKKDFDYYGEKAPSMYDEIKNNRIARLVLLNLPNFIYKFGKKITRKENTSLFSPAHKTAELTISKIKEAKKPFFLFVHFEDTHFPFPTIKIETKIKDKKSYQEILENIKEKSQKEYVKKRLEDISIYSIPEIIKKYDTAIKYVDEQIGKIMDFLKREGLWEKTIFIVLADHGESLGEHKIYFSHAGIYDETVHVPLIMKFPGFEKKEIDGMVQNIDIVPTILDYFGDIENKKKEFDGKSLLGMIKGGKEIRDKAYSIEGLAGDVKSVRTKDRKLIIAKEGRCKLCGAIHHNGIEEYNLKEDDGENKNIYSGESKLKKFLE